MNPYLPPMETARLVIRPFVEADLPAVYAVFAAEGERRAALARWVRWNSLNHAALAELYQPPYGDRAVVLKATGALIGAAGLVPAYGPFDQLPSAGRPAPQPYTPEIGLFYHLAADHRGRGYATEAAAALARFALEELLAKRVVATTEDDNLASQAVMRRLGMRLERNPAAEPVWFQVVGVLDRPGS